MVLLILRYRLWKSFHWVWGSNSVYNLLDMTLVKGWSSFAPYFLHEWDGRRRRVEQLRTKVPPALVFMNLCFALSPIASLPPSLVLNSAPLSLNWKSLFLAQLTVYPFCKGICLIPLFFMCVCVWACTSIYVWVCVYLGVGERVMEYLEAHIWIYKKVRKCCLYFQFCRPFEGHT